MNLLAGLEKFGFDSLGDVDILNDGVQEKPKKAAKGPKVKPKPVVREQDLIIDKKIECPICNHVITYKSVLTTRLKRLEPDDDLRPNFEGIDDTKYGVTVCYHCGYAALNQFFEGVSPGRRKMIRAEICEKFKSIPEPDVDIYTYDIAVNRYKLALLTALAKKAKLSEKSYICLKMAWLRRAQLELLPDEIVEKEKKEEVEEREGFYRQAYDGFTKVLSEEMPPYCGMDANTVEFILANMAMHFGEYDKAAKLVANLLTTTGVSKRMKDKCLDMKAVILEKLKENRGKK
ncbi:MAG: DUF2225 domain-containing protein [Lachnospiraceae bacterium]|nr:DUF2225 domain-containing protein [Lachnospiraceae bacterium]